MSEQANTEQQAAPQFAIQRLYVKDISFESPLGVEIFSKPWKPTFHQELATETTEVTDGNYEVALTVTVTGKLEDQNAFVVEVKQAGLFLLKGFTEDQMRTVVGATCPSLLFPYARQVIDSLMVQGTLPPLMLPPINFDSLFQQALAQQAQGVHAPLSH
jgi:preprotein translocase subunit SecB